MTEKSRPQSGQNKSTSAAAPVLPPPPSYPARTNVALALFCNAALCGAVWLMYAAELPNLLVILGSFFLAMMVLAENMRAEELRSDAFRVERYKELVAYFTDQKQLDAQVAADLKRHMKDGPEPSNWALCGLLLVLAGVVLVIVETYAVLHEVFWLFRVPFMIISGVITFGVLFMLWATSLSTIRRETIDYHTARREQEDHLPAEDLNDIQVIRQLTDLANLNRRIEAYTLESALLSALSFSSFLGIVTQMPDIQQALARLAPPHLLDLAGPPIFQLPVVGNVYGRLAFSPNYLSENMIALIAFWLLLCAVTFLGVLVGRLRFNEGFRDAESCLKSAERLNELEDRAAEQGLEDKRQIYAAEVGRMLGRAEQMEEGLNLTVRHMRLSRDLGILFFVITLIQCGLIFGPYVSVGITLIFVAVSVVGLIDNYSRRFLRERVLARAGRVGGVLGRHRR